MAGAGIHAAGQCCPLSGDPALGQPLCGDCYDYCSHLVWQWWARDLWRRFTITLHRLLAKHLAPAVLMPLVAGIGWGVVRLTRRQLPAR